MFGSRTASNTTSPTKTQSKPASAAQKTPQPVQNAGRAHAFSSSQKKGPTIHLDSESATELGSSKPVSHLAKNVQPVLNKNAAKPINRMSMPNRPTSQGKAAIQLKPTH